MIPRLVVSLALCSFKENRRSIAQSLARLTSAITMHAFREEAWDIEAAWFRMGESHHKSDRKGHPRDERGSSRGVDSFRRERERPDGSER